MKKLVLGCCLALATSSCFGMESKNDRGAFFLATNSYLVAQSKWSWVLPEAYTQSAEIKKDVDEALCRVGDDPSNENVSALLKTIANNQIYANYSHMVFCECFVDLSKDDSVSNRKNALSVVLSDAAVFFSKLYQFTQSDLIDEFNRLISE